MPSTKINPTFLKELIENPETAITHLDLVYVTDKQLSILRKKKDKNTFVYLSPNGQLTKKDQIERINRLVIPPAWEEVRITHLPNGHLQAIGKDVKQRKQYRYHPVWTKVRNQTKFYRMASFGDMLPKIRKQVAIDITQKGWPKTKVLALIVNLMEETHIRIGNEQYAKRNKSYGLTTLRKKHVHIFKDNLKFQFTGKKGKCHEITVRDKKLVRLVSRCEEIPGWELFKFYDREGNKQDIDSEMVNTYLRNISGCSFTAKDFRTWAATTVFFNTMKEIGIAKDKAEAHKNILKGFDTAAKALGNTRNVCRKYYVHPFIAASYEDGSITKHFDLAERLKHTKHFTASEKAILRKIKNYTPLISN